MIKTQTRFNKNTQWTGETKTTILNQRSKMWAKYNCFERN